MAWESALKALAKALAVELPVGVQPEDQLKPPVKALLEALSPHVEAFTEAKLEQGRPDIAVRVRHAVCGYVELKEPGKSADPTRLKGADKRQWQRFQALPNLVYSNGRDWGLYRDGKAVTKVSGVVDASGEVDAEAARKLQAMLTDFIQWQPIVPTTPKALAETLAPLCRMLRDDVAETLEDEASALRELSREIRQALFPNASHRDFADTYAQTLTYALLLARLLGETHLTAESAAAKLDSGHKLLADVLRHMAHEHARREVATAAITRSWRARAIRGSISTSISWRLTTRSCARTGASTTRPRKSCSARCIWPTSCCARVSARTRAMPTRAWCSSILRPVPPPIRWR
jgi:hypothetical protein